MLDRVIHDEVNATLTWLKTKDHGLAEQLDKAFGYAVFPAMGRSSLVVGGATGGGEVFEQRKPVGLAKLSQLTIGVQLGGQTFTEVVLFANKDALEAFKRGEIQFTANASAVLVKAAATGTSGATRKAYSRGGMILEASLGGQKFSFLKHDFKFLEEQGKADGEQAKVPSEPAASQGSERPPPPSGEVARTEAAQPAGAQKDPEPPPHGSNGVPHPESGEQPDPPEPSSSAGVRKDLADAARKAIGGAAQTPVGDAARTVVGKASTRAARFLRPVLGRAHTAEVRDRLAESTRKLAVDASSKAAEFMRSHGATGGRLGVITSRTTKRWLRPMRKLESALAGIGKEAELAPVLESEARAALGRMKEKRPGLGKALDSAYGYAVFPSAGKASAVLGGSYGRGAVFEHGSLTGYAAIVQMTVGVQLGGESFDELVLFENRGAFERFKSGRIAFAANASVAILSTGAATTNKYAASTDVVLHSQGGLILETAIGAQKFVFRSKMLGSGQRPP